MTFVKYILLIAVAIFLVGMIWLNTDAITVHLDGFGLGLWPAFVTMQVWHLMVICAIIGLGLGLFLQYLSNAAERKRNGELERQIITLKAEIDGLKTDMNSALNNFMR